MMLVGEQPGDREDIQGHPFVGPAGKVLDRGIREAGIPADDVYITNVVKHFRYEARGRRRIHQTPDRWQVSACLPWLKAELSTVSPTALVLLGATAAQALLGSQVRIGRDRGKPLQADLAELVIVTALHLRFFEPKTRGNARPRSVNSSPTWNESPHGCARVERSRGRRRARTGTRLLRRIALRVRRLQLEPDPGSAQFGEQALVVRLHDTIEQEVLDLDDAVGTDPDHRRLGDGSFDRPG